MLYKIFLSSCGQFQKVLQCRTNEITHRHAFAFWVFTPSDSFYCKLLFRNTRLHDNALPKEVMKKTLSNCSPAILGIAQKEIALIHHKCHFHYDQKEEKNVKGSSVLEQAFYGRLRNLFLWRFLNSKDVFQRQTKGSWYGIRAEA